MNSLVVDDETAVQPLVEQRFRYRVRQSALTLSFVHSGESALHYVAQDTTKATLVLFNTDRLGTSGLDLLRPTRRGHAAPPPLVMMTAYDNQQSRNQALDFLTNRLDFRQLNDKLSQLQPV